MTLTPADRQRLAEMRQAAEQADERLPWEARNRRGSSEIVLLDGVMFGRVVLAEVHETRTDPDKFNRKAIAAHIASASPERVLWLLDLVERMTPMPRCSICRSDDCRQDHACE
jgi:hypothetical protein